MRNLSLFDVSLKRVDIKNEENIVACFGHNEDSPIGELYVCSHNLEVKNFSADGIVKWSKDLSEIAAPNNSPIDVTFLTLSNNLCVGLENGELFTIDATTNNCDLVGVCDEGILAMEWSPDQELLVIVMKNMETVLMSCTFDPINDIGLLKEEFGEKQFITVGWGKKATQFHGSEGKHARVVEEVVADPNLSDNHVNITWRGDGQLYAVGFNINGLRTFKVFDREGNLQYTCEKQPGLESNLSWRPSGNVIATTQHLSDEYVVAYFEKNGLKHGGFTIPVDKATQVQALKWSADSEILALQCLDTNSDQQKILLFTMSNYHYYLKQTLSFRADQKIAKLFWDNDFDIAKNKTMHILLKNGEFYTYTWIWNVDHSLGSNENDDGIVTVIDGDKVLLTGFRQTVVPPPMAALEIQLESNINSVHFVQKTTNLNPNTFFVCTSDFKIHIYKQTEKFPLQYQHIKTIDIDKYNFPFEYYNWCWVDEDKVACVKVEEDSHSLMEYKINDNALILTNSELLPCAVASVVQHPQNGCKLFLQLNSGEIIEYSIGGGIEPQEVSFPTPCPKFAAVFVEDKVHFLGLSHKGNLHIDDLVILSNVNSMFVHTHFLLLTTLKHVLLCVELTTSGLNYLKEAQKVDNECVYSRKVERGSKLVIAVPCATRTIFQMPRGNLEAIQPRPLSLKIIGNYLDDLKYKEAFDLIRKQRISLNLIYDHDPEKFMNNVGVFLDKITNNSWLSLFLSELQNEDVTKTMYSSSYTERVSVSSDCDKKIDKVCDVIRKKLEIRDDREGRILPLLTTYVKKKSVTDLECALTVVKKLKEQENTGAKLAVSSDEALKYLLYLVEVDKLFDVSLGMYDFDLVLLVANKSQKDPKEFVPMLNQFNEMEESFKKFSVNKHLKRFDQAVECLAECGPTKHEELKGFVKYHSLYRKALELFNPEDEIYKQIADDYGMFLKLKKQYTEAGIVYRSANLYEKAIECFKNALEWELAIECGILLPAEKFMELCRELVVLLQEEKRHTEALRILEFYVNNEEETISYAIQCGYYKTAFRSILKYKTKTSFTTTKFDEIILEAVLKDYNNLTELIQANLSMFTRHLKRLLLVRENKSKLPEHEYYDASFANKDSDLYSDAGSTIASSTSRSSSRTYRSSKNRRKHERKVASLKEGSKYEDVALVMALHTLVTSSFELRTQVREVNLALTCCRKNKEAFILQTSLEKLVKEMKDSFRVIWSNELVMEATLAETAARDVPDGCSVMLQGIATLEPHMRIAPVVPEFSWKLEGLD